MASHVSGAARAVALIVEDDSLLRELAAELLDDAGFVALEAADAEQAIAVLEVRSDVAAIFTDINLPGLMDGLQLAHVVRERWPAIKIVIASGRVRPQRSELPPGSVFLEKPYRGAAVIAHLHDLIDPALDLIGSDTSV
jgi:CheY-like chemotaxis protein